MAKMNVEEIQTTKPPLHITLHLSLQEAAVIGAALDCILSAGEIGNITDGIERTLRLNHRIKKYTQLLLEEIWLKTSNNDGGIKRINIRDVKFPEEE